MIVKNQTFFLLNMFLNIMIITGINCFCIVRFILLELKEFLYSLAIFGYVVFEWPLMRVKKGANQNQNSKKIILQKILKMIWASFLMLKFLYFIHDCKKLSAVTKSAKVLNLSNKVLLCYFYLKT